MFSFSIILTVILSVIITILIISILLWIISQTSVCDALCSMITARSKRYRTLRRAKRIILIRHGESQGNIDSHIYSTVPDHAIGLTEKGKKQARRCGKELQKLIGENETLVCFVSPFRRSRETCDLLLEAFPEKQVIKTREDPRIREQEWGNFQDLATRETTVSEREKIGRFFYRFKNGESGADVYDRVSSFMDSLYRVMDNCLLPNNNVLIVSHGLFMRLFLTRFFRWSIETFHTLENFDNCGYCILERDNSQDGSYVIKTELKTYQDEKPPEIKDLKGSYNETSFDEEVNPDPHTKDIGHNGKKNE